MVCRQSRGSEAPPHHPIAAQWAPSSLRGERKSRRARLISRGVTISSHDDSGTPPRGDAGAREMTVEIALLLAQDGVANGAIYVLVALGIVLIFVVTRVIFVPF